ncbi:ABC transporter substrate-binding protein [Hoeflea olei]|uniref:Taurine ABC transporter substrate-binding protein n=1 Tax=Hoeflea olei TaxID=1480615 RepID=A0A1C1YR68_9HYPH|nr:ABC transporter substrate-binding protein [Hoeflea olei]OCW56061.1 taurine ABC transporter substrate-binding protein [Hoeflea olei]
MRSASGLSAVLAGIAMVATASVAKAEEITVAYFLEWPMPFQYAKAKGLYDEALGMKVNWKSFDAGTAMSAAMASGDIQISVSQGVPPFVVATSAGQDLQVADIAVVYNDNDNCVVKTELEITKDNAKELEGKKVGVPIGTAAHYGFLRQMEHFGVDVSTMEVVDMAPPDGAAAFAQGSLDMFCGWGGSLRRAKEHGNVLLTGAEKDEIGISVYDVTSVPASFAAENSEVLAKFLKVTADMNAKWLTDSAEMLPVIAKDAGMSEEDAADTLKGFQFPTIEAQLSDKWLGKATPDFLKAVGDFFKEQGNIPESRDTYEGAVNTGPLQAASQM